MRTNDLRTVENVSGPVYLLLRTKIRTIQKTPVGDALQTISVKGAVTNKNRDAKNNELKCSKNYFRRFATEYDVEKVVHLLINFSFTVDKTFIFSEKKNSFQ